MEREREREKERERQRVRERAGFREGNSSESSRVRVKADPPGRRWPEAPKLRPLRLDRPSRLTRDRACGSRESAFG